MLTSNEHAPSWSVSENIIWRHAHHSLTSLTRKSQEVEWGGVHHWTFESSEVKHVPAFLTSPHHNSILICEWEHCQHHAPHSLTSFTRKSQEVESGGVHHSVNSSYFWTLKLEVTPTLAPSWSVSEKSMASCSSFTSCSEMRAHKVHSIFWQEKVRSRVNDVHHLTFELSRNRNDCEKAAEPTFLTS